MTTVKKRFKGWKIISGMVIALIFLFIAFKNVEIDKMWEAFKLAHYGYFILALVVLFFSHLLRAWRWQFILSPAANIKIGTLFSALLIGYMANTFLPAHLGEIIRAYLIGKKDSVSSATVFASIVTERIIDIFSLLIVMGLAFIFFPFPNWVKKSGYASFGLTILLFILLLLIKKNQDRSISILTVCLKPLPDIYKYKIIELFHLFFRGIIRLKNKKDYIIVTILSIFIWFCYGYIFHLGLYAFNFFETYKEITWVTPLVILVITTIAVMVPSSPGYIGTYHWLCQISLGLFGVSESDALSYAFAVHGIYFFPILFVGLALVSMTGMSAREIQDVAKNEEGYVKDRHDIIT